MIAAAVRTIFAQPTGALVRSQVDEGARLLDPKFPAVAGLLLDAKADITAFADFPEAHWKKVWSTNPLERLNKEIKGAPTWSAFSPTRAWPHSSRPRPPCRHGQRR